MAKIVRYNGNLVPFASASLGTERTIFGEVTQADDITSQYTADFLRGWGIVGPSDQPTLQDFNAVSYTHGQILSYLHQVGVAEYNALQEYHLHSYVNSAGILYRSLANNNTGNTPLSSPASWANITPLGSTTVAGLLEIATNAEMATGTSTSLVPSVAAVMSLFAKRTFSTNDYIRIPDVNGGLLIQFGLVNCSAAADTPVTFPTPFPGALRFIAGQVISNVNNVGYVFTSESELASGFTCNAITAGGRNAVPALWCAIGN